MEGMGIPGDMKLEDQSCTVIVLLKKARMKMAGRIGLQMFKKFWAKSFLGGVSDKDRWTKVQIESEILSIILV